MFRGDRRKAGGGRLPGNGAVSCSCVRSCPADARHALPSQVPEGLESLSAGTAPAPLPCPQDAGQPARTCVATDEHPLLSCGRRPGRRRSLVCSNFEIRSAVKIEEN